MKKLLDFPFVRQFLSYFMVGGIAAIVEWVCFALFENLLNINYIAATCLAFIFSTSANWLLGRLWTFKESKAYIGKRAKEMALVFAVSAAGLFLNMGLMYLFVSVLGLDTALLKIIDKIVATGIVFFWNFLIRKYVIYK